MKKSLKKLVVAVLATNMALVALPAASIWAQDSEETTEEVSEETSDASSDVTTEESTEEATDEATEEAEAGHALKDVLTETTAENLALLTAYEEYQKVITQFTIQDVAVTDVMGSTYQEVVDGFETSVEAEVFDLNDTDKYLSYTYEINEVSEATNENKAAELIIYFSNDTLMYVGVATLDMEIYPEDVLLEEEIETWIADQVDIKTVADRQTRIMGLSEMTYEGITYHMLFLPTISPEDEYFGDYMIIAEGTVFDSYPLGINEAIESPQTTMLNLFSDFFGFTTEEEVPTEEELPAEEEVPAEESTTEETSEEPVEEESAE